MYFILGFLVGALITAICTWCLLKLRHNKFEKQLKRRVENMDIRTDRVFNDLLRVLNHVEQKERAMDLN